MAPRLAPRGTRFPHPLMSTSSNSPRSRCIGSRNLMSFRLRFLLRHHHRHLHLLVLRRRTAPSSSRRRLSRSCSPSSTTWFSRGARSRLRRSSPCRSSRRARSWSASRRARRSPSSRSSATLSPSQRAWTFEPPAAGPSLRGLLGVSSVVCIFGTCFLRTLSGRTRLGFEAMLPPAAQRSNDDDDDI